MTISSSMTLHFFSIIDKEIWNPVNLKNKWWHMKVDSDSNPNPCFRSSQSAQIQDLFLGGLDPRVWSQSVIFWPQTVIFIDFTLLNSHFRLQTTTFTRNTRIKYHNFGIFCRLYLSTIQHFEIVAGNIGGTFDVTFAKLRMMSKSVYQIEQMSKLD